MNLNGLIGSRDVSATGAVASNFFVRKGQPIASPLVITSPDGTQLGEIAVNNNAEMSLNSESGIVNIASDDGVSENFLFSNNDRLEVVGLNSAVLHSYNSGVKIFANDIASVQVVNGALGRIYDTVYNPTYVISSLNNNTTNACVYDQTEFRISGVYQLQLSIEVTQPSDSSVLSLYAIGTGSQVINFSGAAINAAAVSATQLIMLNSGFFAHEGGNLRVVLEAQLVPLLPPLPAQPWTGTWSLQLIRMN